MLHVFAIPMQIDVSLIRRLFDRLSESESKEMLMCAKRRFCELIQHSIQNFGHI